MNPRQPTTCAYCGSAENLTRDHVVPLCLFTRPLPDNLITVPACAACQAAKATDDPQLRDLVAVDLHGHAHPIAREILDGKILRSIRRKPSEVLQAIRSARLVPYYTPAGIYLGDVRRFELPEGAVVRLLGWVVRGLYFYHRHRVFPATHRLDGRRHQPQEFGELYSGLSAPGHRTPTLNLGEVFGCAYLHSDVPFQTLWLLWFYRAVVFSIFSHEDQEIVA